MKPVLILFLVFSFSAFAETLELNSGVMEYKVKHLIKTVTGTSKEVKGKMECAEAVCDFLLGAQVKSFVSSDSNRDLNMVQTTEAGKFPVTSATGKIEKSLLEKPGSFSHAVEVNFHSIKKTYQAKTEVMNDLKMKSVITLSLDAHKVERPSLFGVKIDDEVPMNLEMSWIRK